MAKDNIKIGSLHGEKPLSLVDQVAMKIRSVIQSGNLQSGEKIPPEHELIDQLGVSRVVVREAIGQLQTVGLLEIRRGRGTYVNDRSGLRGCVELIRTAIMMSAGQLKLFSELRSAIEAAAARKAAEDGVDVLKLDELEELARETEADGKSPEEAMQLDLRFHLKLVELSDNRVMLDVMEVLQELMVEGMARTTPKPRARQFSLQAHLAIVDAIRARDPDGAQKAVDTHMQLLLSRLENIQQKEDELSQEQNSSNRDKDAS